MNKDYENQESTEENTEKILKNDTYLNRCLKEDNIEIEDIINFKQYNIVDNERPKVCADRLDGVILTGISWTKNVDYEEDLIYKLKKAKDSKLLEYFDKFENITVDEISSINLPNVKIRDLNPLVQGKRIK